MRGLDGRSEWSASAVWISVGVCQDMGSEDMGSKTWGQVLFLAPSQALDQASGLETYPDKTERNLADVPTFAIGV